MSKNILLWIFLGYPFSFASEAASLYILLYLGSLLYYFTLSFHFKTFFMILFLWGWWLGQRSKGLEQFSGGRVSSWQFLCGRIETKISSETSLTTGKLVSLGCFLSDTQKFTKSLKAPNSFKIGAGLSIPEVQREACGCKLLGAVLGPPGLYLATFWTLHGAGN